MLIWLPGHNTQLSESRAAHIDNALLATLEGGRLSSVASLQLQVRLLHAVRPTHFGSFRSFARWQQTTATMLSSIATWSANNYRQEEARSLSARELHSLCRFRVLYMFVTVCAESEFLSMLDFTRATPYHLGIWDDAKSATSGVIWGPDL